jgi:predicted porin
VGPNVGRFSSGVLTPSVIAFHIGDLDRLVTGRIDNAVRYGGQPDSISSGSAFSFGATYRAGNFRADAAYVEIRNFAMVFGVGVSYQAGAALFHALFTTLRWSIFTRTYQGAPICI